MSVGLAFLPRPTDGDRDAAMEAQEGRAEADPRRPTEGDPARVDVVDRAVRSVLPDATAADGAHWRELDRLFRRRGWRR